MFNKTNLKGTHNDKLEAEARRVHTVQNEQIWRRSKIQDSLTGSFSLTHQFKTKLAEDTTLLSFQQRGRVNQGLRSAV